MVLGAPFGVIVTVPDAPAATLTLVGLAVMLNAVVAAPTVRLTVVLGCRLPDVPVTVMG